MRNFIEIVRSLLGQELFEMANLDQTETGIPGLIYISTQQASHGPRIKYYPSGKKSEPYYVVTISDRPSAIRSRGVSKQVFNQTAPAVMDWVIRNHEILTDFWFNGNDWTESYRREHLRFV